MTTKSISHLQQTAKAVALEAYEAGLCVVPPREDGSKQPIGEWKRWQKGRPSRQQLNAWYRGGREGIGLVCGAVSGNLEMYEFENEEVYQAFKETAEAAGMGSLVDTIENGYLEKTPGGGYHWLYYCREISGNTPLARKPDPTPENPRKVKPLIETRGEGGYTVCAPSFGRVHSTGKPYVLLRGSFKTIVTITPEQRKSLFDLGRTFDEMPVKDVYQPQRVSSGIDVNRPGDDFNQRADWREIMEPAGWQLVFERGGTGYWRRPGKDRGVSATTNHGGSNLFYVFSTSTDFEPERGYSKFSVYSILNHNGDFQAAAQSLVKKGYGHEQKRNEGAEDGPPWEPPIPFADYKLPSFPVEVLPGWMRGFAAAEAEATQTPPDLAGMLALAVCAAAAAKKIVVHVREGWTEPVNLFVVVALPPASRKSVVFADIAEPVVEYEEELARQASPEIEEAKTRRRIIEQSLQQKQNEAARAKDAGEREQLTREATELARELTTTAVPAPPRLVADDCSPEKLAGLVNDQGGRIAILSPEGDTFDLMAGRYSNSTPNLGIYLKGHAGDTLRVDRVGRPPEYVKAPALTVGLAVQPDVLCGLIDKPGFRGRGLLARFLYSLPKSIVGRREDEPAPVPEHVRRAYRRNLRRLLELPAGTDDKGQPIAHALRLSPEAERVFATFRRQLEPQLAETGPLGSLQDWAGKLAGAVARIAGVLHIATHVETPAPWTKPINEETMQAAITLGKEYLITHAKAAFAEMGADPDIKAARYVLEWIERKGCEEFTKRDLHNGLQGRFKRVAELEPPLTLLVEHGYIREKITPERTGPGRKPSSVFEVNPLSTQSTQSTQFLPPGGQFCILCRFCMQGCPPKNKNEHLGSQAANPHQDYISPRCSREGLMSNLEKTSNDAASRARVPDAHLGSLDGGQVGEHLEKENVLQPVGEPDDAITEMVEEGKRRRRVIERHQEEAVRSEFL